MHEDALAIVRSALAERYEVQKEIGRGGMALVWRARDLRHDRDVAIKVLYPELARAVGGDRFLREIRILARLSHPHILPLLDSGTVEIMPGLLVPWYVMPFVAEETLRVKLTREGPLPVPVALRYTRELCSALTHAHAQGYIHRDIKPENILLRGDEAVLADFGIARAVTVASGTALSSTGLVVGTPAYMSPEQSLGSDKLDARSDIYSLGVVLYEMLAGHPPFSGATPQAISARHQFETPPPIGVVRPGLPSGVEAVVTKALAKVPADRYGTAGELDGAVCHSVDTVPTTGRARTRLGWWTAAGLATVVGIGLWAGTPKATTAPLLNPDRYMVLPFQTRGDALPALLYAGYCEELIADALARWTDLSVVSPLTVGSAITMPVARLTLSEALAIARRLGAGRMLWGEVSELADTVRVRGVLYDAQSGTELRTHTVRFAGDTKDLQLVSASFVALMYALVLPSTPTPEISRDALGTVSLAAWRAYASGDSALKQWNLTLAQDRFRASLALDPEYPSANLRFAEVSEWLDEPAADWGPFAKRAAGAERLLTPRDRMMAAGLVALAGGDYPGACDQYRAMVASDSMDFRGWFGLGECQADDDVVLTAQPNDTGWRFRGSFQGAATAYLRALRAAPAAHRATRQVAAGRLSRVMFASRRLRAGRGTDQDSTAFLAWQGLEGDTLSFVPYPQTAFTGPTPPGIPKSAGAAIKRNRDMLLALTAEWVAEFPESRPAWQHRAWELERNGQLVGPAESSALTAITRARAQATDSAEQIGLVVDQVRILVKAERFREARLLVDSALTTWPLPSAEGARQLAPLAALTGRLARTQGLLAIAAADWDFTIPDGRRLTLPGQVAEPALALYANAVLGGPPEEFAALEHRVRESIASWAPRTERALYEHAAMDLPAAFGFPINGLRPIHNDWATGIDQSDLEPQVMLARGDTARLHARLIVDVHRWRDQAPDMTPAPENAFLAATMLLALGDTTTASTALDLTLELLPSQSLNLLLYAQSAALLIRSMALRAELSATHDTRTTTRWGSGVTALWEEADPALRDLPERMTHLIAH